MIRKLQFLMILGILSSNLCIAQDLNYTLSDDSLVNVHASNKKVYYATRTELVPKIDGILDDECWKSAGSWGGEFVQQQPHQAKAPSQQTEFKILYDDKYLYFAIICHDNEPDKMDVILGRRDDNQGDMAGIAIDSYLDKQTAFEFNVTAAGQKVDLMHLGEYGWDFNWNAVWDGKSSVGDSAWYAEMRVPFTQIRFANQEEHVWGMHIWRWLNRSSEESQWKLIPIDAPAMVYIFGELRGIKDIPYKRNFEVMPYAKAKYIPESTDKQNFGFGLDGKIGVTSDFTLDYTFNPDFGQVEADPSELNLTSYETFYEEKRPFFLEGNSILEYNSGRDRIFYSRRIGHAPSYTPGVDEDESYSMPDNTTIINALKLTGKSKNGLSVGLVNSMTAREEALIYSGDIKNTQAVEPFTNYTIGRLKKDFNEGSTVLGGIFTSTFRNIKDEQLEFLPDNSLVGGLDFEHNWLNRKYFVAAKSFYSTINGSEQAISSLQRNSRHYYQREDAEHLDYNSNLTNLDGWGGEIGGGKRSGKFHVLGELEWRSPGIDLNDVGYMRQADYIDEDFTLLYQVNKPKGILLNYLIGATQRHQWSYGGENLSDRLHGMALFRFKNYWKIIVSGDQTFRNIDTRQLRGGPSLRIDNITNGGISLSTDTGRDLFFSAGVNLMKSEDNISKASELNFEAKWMISKRLSLTSESGFSKEVDNAQYVKQKTINSTREYVVGNISRQTFYTTLRAEFFITPELSLQYYGSPYVSTGKYLDYRKVEKEDSKSKNLDERYSNLTLNPDNLHLVDGDNNIYHDFNDYDFNFNFQEFRSNFVARWEYKTGSTVYFVWTNNRSQYVDQYNSSLFNSLKGISKIKADNAFMIKLSYWFSL